MASESLNPLDYPYDWDVVRLGGVISPGLAIIGEVERAYDWDIKQGKGSDGATITYTGRPPAEFTVKFQFWQRGHFDEWAQFLPLLKYDPTKTTAQAIDIFHPALADIDITSVVTTSIGAITHEGRNLYSVSVKFLEYFPPSKQSAVSTPTVSKTEPDPPDPIADAQLKEIADLTKTATEPPKPSSGLFGGLFG